MKLFLAHKLVFLALTVHGLAALDSWSTRRVFVRYAHNPRIEVHELNPLLEPFFKGPALYPVQQLSPLACDWILVKAKKRRKLAVALTVAVAVGHATFVVHNLTVRPK